MLKEYAFHICRQHLNRPVRLHTKTGMTVEGTVVDVDAEYVYVRVSVGASVQARGFYPPPPPRPPGFYGPQDQIMTLALFDLLAITLLLL